MPAPSRLSLFKEHLRVYFFQCKSKASLEDWEACWLFLNTYFPVYAFRTAATYNYNKSTGTEESKTKWGERGPIWYIKFHTVVKLYAEGELNSSY